MAEWFQSWFDSEYYHILYRDRDYTEAERFIQNLFKYFHFEDSKRVLDLACGKGRHSKTMNELGHFVTGVDLSKNSIDSAKRFSNDTLEFYEHDMRQVFRENFYDLVVNLFTSFGYFDDPIENEKVLNNVHVNLKPRGIFVLDYLNPGYVKKGLVAKTTKSIDGINFEITKKIEDSVVYKNISFKVNGKDHHHQERVRLFDQRDFMNMFERQNFKLLECWGNYDLDEYELFSPRQIFLLEVES